MTFLDMRTLVFSYAVIGTICLLVVLLLWHQTRKRFAGAGFWAFDFAFQTVAMFLIIMRGSIPDSMSMVLSNTLVVGGAILGYMGLGRFVGKNISQFHNYVLLAAFACVHAYFTFVQPNLTARSINLSVGLLIVCFQCMWLLVYRVDPGMRRLTLGVGLVFGAYCLVSIVRIIGFIAGPQPVSNYFYSGAFESLILISYQILFILLTYTLVLMVNKRLFVEVKTQEEKFAKAFQSSPDAITLTRLSDGEIVEANDSFLNISGYQYGEAIGKTPVDLHLWDKEEELRAVVKKLSKSGKVHGRELQFRKKSGEMITGLFSADIIQINNQEFVLSSVRDITERKRAEEALRYRTLELQQMSEMLDKKVQERTAELENANKTLQELSSRLLSAQEEERKRIAGEIHDTLGACLAAIKFKVEDVLQQIEKTAKAPAQSLSTIVPVIQDAVEECRRIQMDLRPSILDDLGLLPTLSWFCRRFQTIYSGIRIKREINIEESKIPKALKIVIYRVTQEGMNNIAKHSQANLVRLSLRNIDARIELVLEDNGKGFNLEKVLSPPGRRRGLGLTSIKERVELSGGSFAIESAEGKGTTIRASWPLHGEG